MERIASGELVEMKNKLPLFWADNCFSFSFRKSDRAFDPGLQTGNASNGFERFPIVLKGCEKFLNWQFKYERA